MTIRHRITLLVILMFVALSAIGGYAVYQTRGSASEVRQVTEGVVPSALASADLVSQVKDVQIAIMTLVYAPDANMVSQAQNELKAKRATLKQALALQARDAASHAQKGLVAQAQESLDNYFAAIDETANMKVAGKNELAQAYLFANVAQYRDELEGIVDTLRIEKNREKDEAIKTLNDTLATTTTAIAAVTGVAILLLTSIGALLYRQITRPLIRMQAMMSEIASSQDFTRRVPVGRMDEIGRSIVAFNGMIEKIQENSALLKQKTADIQAMLQNMQQGILTVVDGAVVHSEYSAYLEAIFETNEIAGRRLMDLVFSDTDLGADVLSQIDAATYACLGEDAINFEFNQHLLVGEIAKHMPDGRVKTLDLSWSAITDENDVIVRLMLCGARRHRVAQARGRGWRTEAQTRNDRRDPRGQRREVPPLHRQFDRFCQRKRADHPQVRAGGRNGDCGLFRNMHTIKGNARTYNLQYLTNVVHETEQSYDALRRPDAERVWDQESLMSELARVREAIDSYAKINEVSLGRKRLARRGGVDVDRYLMVDSEHIQHSLRLIEAANTGDVRDLVSMRDALHRTLRVLGTESVAQTLSGVIESLPSLATGQGGTGRAYRRQRLSPA